MASNVAKKLSKNPSEVLNKIKPDVEHLFSGNPRILVSVRKSVYERFQKVFRDTVYERVAKMLGVDELDYDASKAVQYACEAYGDQTIDEVEDFIKTKRLENIDSLRQPLKCILLQTDRSYV